MTRQLEDAGRMRERMERAAEEAARVDARVDVLAGVVACLPDAGGLTTAQRRRVEVIGRELLRRAGRPNV